MSEWGEIICERLAKGESLRSICRTEGYPSDFIVRGWVLDDRDGFASQYARAREKQSHAIADELLEIADDARNDWMDRLNAAGDLDTTVRSEHIQRSRVRIDTRKWLLSKMLPKVYGDKVQHTDASGHGPVMIVTGVSRAEDAD